MKLLTKEILKQLPAIYSTEKVPVAEKMLIVKFFTPTSSWTWYATEYDPIDRRFFGLVVGLVREWGYFSLDELESVKGPLGVKVERDRWFKPCTLDMAAKSEHSLKDFA